MIASAQIMIPDFVFEIPSNAACGQIKRVACAKALFETRAQSS